MNPYRIKYIDALETASEDIKDLSRLVEKKHSKKPPTLDELQQIIDSLRTIARRLDRTI